MSGRVSRRLAAGLLAAMAAAACGKRGNPLPPLRTIPSPIADLAAHRLDNRIELSWTVPDTNTDGTSPPSVVRVDLYAVSTTAAEPAPAAEAVRQPANLAARMPIRTETSTAAAGAAAQPAAPAPGERASLTERVDALAAGGATARHYVAIPVAASGRPGPPSDLLTVSLAADALPAPPAGVAATHDDTRVTVRWTPAAAGQTFRVLASGPVFDPAAVTPLTPTPVAAAEFTEPVVFGQERCYVVRAVDVEGRITLESPPTSPVCLTPADRFPPAAPATLQAIQEGAAVALVWARVEAGDLGGYVILRGEGAGENMQPLVSAPVQGTSYRDETVQPGVTYVYAVYAVDRTEPPNVSQLSPRQTVTVR